MPKAIETLFAKPAVRGDWIANSLQKNVLPGQLQGPPKQMQGSSLDEKALIKKGFVGVYAKVQK